MTLKLYDLGDVVSIVLGSMAGVLAFFQIIRSLFLDKLVKGRLDAEQQNVLYHALVWLIIAALIVAQALLKGYQFSPVLALSAIVAAFPIQRTVNLVFQGVQQIKVSSGQQLTTLGPGVFVTAQPEPPQPPDPVAPIVVPAESDPAAPDKAA